MDVHVMLLGCSTSCVNAIFPTGFCVVVNSKSTVSNMSRIVQIIVLGYSFLALILCFNNKL